MLDKLSGGSSWYEVKEKIESVHLLCLLVQKLISELREREESSRLEWRTIERPSSFTA